MNEKGLPCGRPFFVVVFTTITRGTANSRLLQNLKFGVFLPPEIQLARISNRNDSPSVQTNFDVGLELLGLFLLFRHVRSIASVTRMCRSGSQ